MGNAGVVIISVCLIALLGIVGTLVLAYAAQCFGVVVEETAAGLDEIVWPSEPPTEWMGRAVLLGWQVLVWLAPLGLLLRALKPAFVKEEPWLIVVLVGVILWLFFPIGVLSALTGGSRWAFFKPKLLLGLSHIPVTALGFYALTPLLLAAGLYPWYFAVRGSALLVPVAALVGAAALLIYARLLGRVAWRLNHLKKFRPARFRAPTLDKPMPRAVIMENPWEPPPEPKPKRKKRKKPEQTEFAAAEDVYGLASEPVPAPERPVELLEEGYTLQKPESSAPSAPPDLGPEPPSASALEMRLAERTPQARAPTYPLFSGVFTFPWYTTTLRAWVWLGMGGSAVGFILKMMPDLPD